MFKESVLNFLQDNIESEYVLQLIDVIYTPLIILLVLYLLYRLLKFIYYKIKENKYHKKLASSGIRDIDRMDGLQFEFYLKALFKELGYKAEVTKASSDFGADLIIKNNNEKIVVQAKRYKYKSNVSLDAVQQIYTAIPYYKADAGWIITNSFYTKSAKKLADITNIKLLNRHELINFINKIQPTITPKEIKRTVQPQERKCPECKSDLIVRYSKTGNEFFGCTKYPDCKHTESIAK